jgi:integrase
VVSPLLAYRCLCLLLGHSSIAVTSDIYSHVMPGMKGSAVDRFAEAFGDTYN